MGRGDCFNGNKNLTQLKLTDMKKLLALIFVFILIDCKKDDFDKVAIPEGAIWVGETIRRDTPIPGYAALAVWAQAATLKGDQSTDELALVTVDHWEVVEIVNQDSMVIYSEEYDFQSPKYFNANEAGLYCRYPRWFDIGCKDEHSEVVNMVAYKGFMTLDIAQTPSTVVHWWTPKLSYRQGAKYCIRARLKIEGKTSVQFGMDYWRTLISGFNVYDASCETSNNCEAWISDWIGETNGEFVTVTVPKRR